MPGLRGKFIAAASYAAARNRLEGEVLSFFTFFAQHMVYRALFVW